MKTNSFGLYRRIGTAVIMGFVLGLLATGANAATLFWDHAGGTWDITNGNYWYLTGYAGTTDPATGAPGTNDTAVFGVFQGAQINLNSSPSVAGLLLTGSGALVASTTPETLTIGSAGLSLLNNFTSWTVGSLTPTNAVTIDLAGNQAWNLSQGSGFAGVFNIDNGVTNASASAPVTLTLNATFAGATTTGTYANFYGVISDGGTTTALTVNTMGYGVINVAPANSAPNTYTGATTVQSSILQLNFANNTSVLSSSTALVLGGGALLNMNGAAADIPVLKLTGTSNATDAQTFAGTTLNKGYSAILINGGGGLGGAGATSVTANLGGITRNAGAVLNITGLSTAVLSGSNANTYSAPNTTSLIATTTGSNDASGIMGDWITVGGSGSYNTAVAGGTGNNFYGAISYATVNGSGQIVAYTGATSSGTNLAAMTSATTNYVTGAAGTLAASATGNTLQMTAGNVNLGSSTLTLNGLLNSEAGTWSISNSSAAGQLVIGSNNELVVTGSSSQVSINVPIVNNPGHVSGVTYATQSNLSNAAAVVLGGQSTYTGTTYLSAGSVEPTVADVAGTSGAFGNGGNITFAGGMIYYPTITVALGTDYSSRFKNSASPISAYINDGNVPVTWNGVIDSSNTGGLNISTPGATETLVINGSNSFTGTSYINGDVNLILGNGSALGAGKITIDGAVALSAAVPLTGSNALTASFLSTYGGATWLTNGINSIQVSGTLGSADDAATNRVFGNDIVGGMLTINTLNLSNQVVTPSNFYLTGYGNTNIGSLNSDPSGVGQGTTFQQYSVGTVTLTGSSNVNTGFYFFGGVTNLNFAAPGAPQNNMLANYSTGLNFGGGTLELTGNASQANFQTLGGNTTLNAGYSQLMMNPTGQALGINVLGFQYRTGGVLNVLLSGSSSSTNGVVTSSVADTLAGILPSIVVNGNDWGTKGSGSTSSNVVAFGNYYDQPAVNTWPVTAWPTASGSDVSVSGADAFSGALASSGSVASLHINNAGGGTIDLGGFTLNPGDGILISGNVGGAVTIKNGTIAPSNNTAYQEANNVLIVNNAPSANPLTISANVTNQTLAPTTIGALTIAGTGTTILSGTGDTYTGTTYVSGGILVAGDEVNYATVMTSGVTTANASSSMTVTNAAALSVGEYVFGTNIQGGTTITGIAGTTVTLSAAATSTISNAYYAFGTVTPSSGENLGGGNLQLDNGVLGLTGSFYRLMGSGAGEWSPGNTAFGFAACNGTNTVNVNIAGLAGLAGGNIVWSTGMDTYRGGAWGNTAEFILGASSATGMINFMNNIDVASNGREINVVEGANGDAGSVPFDAQISGVVSASGFVPGIAKVGNGILWLSNTNTYQGETVVEQGEITENGVGLINVNSPLIVMGPTASFDLSGTTTIAHSNTVYSVTLINGNLTGNSASSLISTWGYNVMSGTASVALGNSIGSGSNSSLTKTTSGTVKLSGNSTYAGSTSVLAGTLLVSGSISGGGAVTVGDPANLGTMAILSGSGTVLGPVNIGAAPGNTGAEIEPSNGVTESVGTTMNTGNLTIGTGASVALQIGRSDVNGQATYADDTSDHIIVGGGGTITLAGNLELSLQTGYTPAIGDVFYLIISNGFSANTTGQFVTVNGNPVSSGQFSYDNYIWNITNAANSGINSLDGGGTGSFTGGYDEAIEVASAVPEPGTWAMLVAGFGMLFGIRRRFRCRA